MTEILRILVTTLHSYQDYIAYLSQLQCPYSLISLPPGANPSSFGISETSASAVVSRDATLAASVRTVCTTNVDYFAYSLFNVSYLLKKARSLPPRILNVSVASIALGGHSQVTLNAIDSVVLVFICLFSSLSLGMQRIRAIPSS